MTRVLVTSTRLPAELPQDLDIVHVPLLAIEPLPLPALPDHFEAVFYSIHGVEAVTSRVDAACITRAFAVGSRTSAALRILVDDVVEPDVQTFVGVMAVLNKTPAKHPRVSFELQKTPRRAADHTDVLSIAAYRSIPVTNADVEGTYDWVVFASPRAAERFFATRTLDGARTAVIGPTTAAHLRDLGVKPDIVSTTPNLEALLQSVAAVSPKR